ncbi:microtubule organization protein AKNA [Chelonoidis abingdonii]|uniref:microtubule organization protein AKNA n=1 Tax=Chelonoidis abingdonii TaxID=106734 RepID=UPI0013F1FFA0|nr:microtubule organization protein AKNA [Chelonoidis abingdonii]XP_032653637.1 microtubule organization protein AKNA [Chelonoidis abingdonii]XP_032653638.1 microtubule organization protein AKNA [Chelonoidis abingdonii]
MASSAPWAHWGEAGPGHGAGQQQCWEEEVAQGSEGYMEENGVTGLDENGLVGHAGQWGDSLAQDPTELEFQGNVRLTKGPPSPQGLLAQSDRNFNLSELQEFEWSSAQGDNARSPPADDGEELEHDGTQEDPTFPAHWHPQRDRQLDMTEEDEDRPSSGDVERQEGDWEAGSEGEGYPELSFEGQYGSEYSSSPDALQDTQALYRDYGKSFSFTTDGGEELSGHSDVSPPPSSTLLERSHKPSQRSGADVFESQSQLGESLEFPAETESSSPSSGHLDSPELSPLADSKHRSLSRSLLHHLSVEDLENAPSIDAETFPESSYTESMEDAPQTIFKATSAARARASHRLPVPADEPSESSRLKATEAPPSLRHAGSQQQDRAQTLKKALSPALPSKFSRQSRSLSPRGNTRKQAERSDLPKSGPARPSLAAAETSRYRRGQLNYPLPDLSKVEPRVKFPKDDQSYRPPRGRTLPMRARGSASPVVFKSPAEIVQEVLLSSAEGSLQKCPTPSTTMVPEEFKSPQQATELVKQLQEDYHRLLTKYAEAENTIDRLRLRAKVSLYADPPKPSHSVHMGTMAHSSKVMAFSIPQIQTAEFSTTPALALPAGLAEGPLSAPDDQAPSFPAHSSLTSVAGVDACTSTEKLFPEDPLTQTLADQARKFEMQVESFEGLIQMGGLTPRDQLSGFARLKDAQDALERAYLQAREEYRLQQQCPGAARPLGDFDPDRVVEGEIFRLGMRLEELKDGIDRALQILIFPRSCSEPALPPSCLPTLVSEPPLSSPRPSVQAPIPALRTPYPEAPVPKHARAQMQVDAEVSSASGETEKEREELPEPLRHKQLQVEKDFDNLLDHYNSFKSLPESLSMEQLALEENNSPREVDGPAAEDAGTAESPHGMLSLKEERTHVTAQLQPPERRSHALQPRERRQLVRKSNRLSSVQGEESLPRNMAIKASSQDAIPKPSFGGQQETLSRQSSMASRVGSAISEHLPQKPFRQAKSLRSEDQRILSPETDSGFVGSEASRVSPLTRTPEHRPSHTATPGMLGRSGPASSPAALRTSLRKEAAPLPSEKELLGTYTSASQAPPRGSSWRHRLPRGSPSQTSSPPQWTNSITSEVGPDTDITHTDSEAEQHSRAGASGHRPSKTRCPPSSTTTSLSPGRAHHGLLGSRMERDQAIQALQDEVSRLQQRLEESLHQSHSYPEGKSSPRTARSRRQPVGNGPSVRNSAPFGESAERSPGEFGEPAPVINPARRVRSASLPRDGPERDLTSELDCPPPRARDGKPRTSFSSRQSPPRTLTFKGHYTGTRYHLSAPVSPERREDTGPTSCLHCQRTQAGSASAGDTVRPTQHSTPRKTHCPICNGTRSTPLSKTRDKAAQATGRHTESASSQGPGLSHKTEKPQQQQQPGLWYLAVPPPGTAINYIPTVPVVPYSPSVLYCSPPAPTSVPGPAGLPVHYSSLYRVAELKPRAAQQQAHGRHHSLMLDFDDLEDLNWSLSRAVEATKSMKLTTKQMNRSLTSELNKARRLRGSCLF